MCGITGIMAGPLAPPVAREELTRMAAMLVHRGPDGWGLYRDDRVGLGHTRLSLIDLECGHQPIRNGDGSLWLVFNGEIFNYLELRLHLKSLGSRFYTNGDSEVIVQCYERYGPEAWRMLNGQFAFALWDRRSRKLWLVRDRLGILPLHYAVAGGHLLFASEAKALFAGGRLAPRFSPAGLAEVFVRWSAAPPRTVFEGVSQVPPATALCFDETLNAEAVRYWQPVPSRPNLARISDDDAEAALEEHLARSITLRLRADVPVGSYVSGGLDSSLVSAMAAAQLKGGTLNTFGIRFEDPRFDETAGQRLMARAIGSHHHEILVSAADIRNALDEVIWRCETPLLRTAPVPLFLLSRLVQEAGVKTVLTGEGADELLAGYNIFKEDQIRRFWARQPESKMRPALLARIHHYVGTADARATALWQSFFRQSLTDTANPFYSHLIRWQNTAWTLRLLAPHLRGAVSLDGVMAELAAAMPDGWRKWEPLTRAQVIEMHSFMSSYLLSCQGDRVAMAHGIEARYPFLDPDFADFALALPKRLKLLGLRDKVLLRRVAARRLPQEIWKRRKQPFRAPIGAVLFGPEGRAQFAGLLEPHALAAQGLCDAKAVSALLARAERLEGRGLGEREEMGLAGVLTLAMLARHFGAGFAAHVEDATARFRRLPLHIDADQAAPQQSRMALAEGDRT
jgi:asparagine synthase (glutamine-hydrolysing)